MPLNLIPLFNKIACFIVLLISVSLPVKAQETMFSVRIVGQGKPVILIPGLMSSGDVWNSVVRKFEDQAQLHVLSVAGFAGQAPIEEPSIQRLADEIHQYIENNNLQNPIIVGHSLGGFTAMLLATQHPDSIGQIISVDGLPFIGPVFTGSNTTTVDALLPQAQQMKRYFASMSAQQLAQQTKMGITRQTLEPSGQKLVIDMALQSDPITVSQLMFDVMTTDLRDQLVALKHSITLIGASGALPNQAAKDQTQLLYQQQLQNTADGQVIMHEDARHFVMLDAPEWLNEQLATAMGI